LESSYLHFNEEGWRGRSLVFVTGWLSSLLPTLGAISMVLTPDSGRGASALFRRKEGRPRACAFARASEAVYISQGVVSSRRSPIGRLVCGVSS